MNAESLRPRGKRARIEVECLNNRIDVLLISETHLEEDEYTEERENWKFYHQHSVVPSHRQTGGVGIFVSTEGVLQRSRKARCVSKGDESFEIVACTVTTMSGGKIRFICCYDRPTGANNPDSIRNDNTANLCEQLESLLSKDVPTVIVGDFNLPDIDWDYLHEFREGTKERTFLDFVRDNKFVQHIREPTYCGSNTLDLVLTRSASTGKGNIRIEKVPPFDLNYLEHGKPQCLKHKAIMFGITFIP